MQTRDPAPRALAFALVLLLHGAVLVVGWRRATFERTEQRALTLVDVEPDTPAPPAELNLDVPLREPDLVVPSMPNPEVELEPESRAITVPSVDWRSSMEATASAAAGEIIRREGYRSFGPAERRESGSAAPQSLFDQPRHKAGDVEADPSQGRTLIWQSRGCYTELKFPTLKDPNALPGAPNLLKCVIAK